MFESLRSAPKTFKAAMTVSAAMLSRVRCKMIFEAGVFHGDSATALRGSHNICGKPCWHIRCSSSFTLEGLDGVAWSSSMPLSFQSQVSQFSCRERLWRKALAPRWAAVRLRPQAKERKSIGT